jgi:hypothetical protein
MSNDPLAMIHALFPYFWFILSGYFILCVILFLSGEETKSFVYILVLVQLSLVLYFTPFALSGISWNPDSPWLSALSKYMPDILSGKQLVFSTYPQTYPSSFVFADCIMQVTGIDVFTFARFYPVFSIIALTLLGYVFASKFFEERIAFFSMLLVLAGWHYVDFHASPHMAGLLLLVTIMVLATRTERKSMAIIFLLVPAFILSHPISPINLGIFLLFIFLGMVIIRMVFRIRSADRAIFQPLSGLRKRAPLLLLVVAIGWIYWMLFWVLPNNTSIQYALKRVLSLNLTFLTKVNQFSVGGGSFIYPQIFRVEEITYLSYVAVAGILTLQTLIAALRRRGKLSQNRLVGKSVLLFPAFAFIAFSYSLLLATGDQHLLYRGLIPFILVISIFIASCSFVEGRARTRKISKIGAILLSLWLLFLLLVFPIVSYYIAAYTSIPYSEGVALKFIAEKVNLAGKTTSIGSSQQITAYADPHIQFENVGIPEPSVLSSTRIDVIALRKTSYYVTSMRYDLSFENNSFVQLARELEGDVRYAKIYSSPTTETYLLNP